MQWFDRFKHNDITIHNMIWIWISPKILIYQINLSGMDTCKINMYTCRMIMYTCKIIMYTCKIIQTSNIRRTWIGNEIVDHSDVVGASHCSNYIFILDLTPGFNGLRKGNCKTRRESFKFWDLVCLILDILRHVYMQDNYVYIIA